MTYNDALTAEAWGYCISVLNLSLCLQFDVPVASSVQVTHSLHEQLNKAGMLKKP
jgi:hypothetical protein